MTTCVSCGSDVTGKKFCPECGTPVQSTGAPTMNGPVMTLCPRCSGEVKSDSAFCMHCGSALHAVQPSAPVQAYPTTRPCPACHMEVPIDTMFCIHCGQNMSTPVAPVPVFCNNCGKQNAPGVKFCGGCGSPLATSVPPTAQYSANYGTGPSGQYPQPQQYPQQLGQYSQPQYGQPQYQPQQYDQYNQGGYQQQPMVGQQPMTLRCPVCMAMSPMGTSNCPSCRTSLVGVVPTPMNMPVQGQQGMLGGGVGNFLQGNNGKMAMGALGGAAAVLGGEMLLHGVENSIENRDDGGMGYERRHHHREEGLLGGLGDIANDVGLF
jgi:hypothetical protein